MNVKKITFVVWAVFSTTFVFSQIKISGTVLDAQNHKPLQGVQIQSKQHNNVGALTGVKGDFVVEIPQKNDVLIFKYLGYNSKEIKCRGNKNEISLGEIFLNKRIYPLNEITVSSGLVKDNNAAVSITEIRGNKIRSQLSDNPLPLILNIDPSVFAVRNGGGSGDAVLNVRGFKQENVALLLNGIPINGEENGLVYWSNWLGLSDATAAIQIQKGPGFANLTSNAIGGSINILTKKTENEKGGNFNIETTNYGNRKISFSLNSGTLPGNWQISCSGSVFGGKGYIDATPVKGASYFIVANKIIDKKNEINFTLIGAPQYHEQRTIKLSYSEMLKHGYKFNKDWG